MHRFYLEEVYGGQGILTDAQQVHHLRDVLRLKSGDSAVIIDAQGKKYNGIITRIERQRVWLSLKPISNEQPRQVKITIACALPKSGFDDLIDALVQLGVSIIVPMETVRVVAKLDEKAKGSRMIRWQIIARNAAQQSQRDSLPILSPITRFEQVLVGSQNADLKLIPTLDGERQQIRDAIKDKKPTNVVVLIGPEGDFTTAEVKLARDAGFLPVSLGDTVLRVATAAIAVVSYLKLSLNAP